MRNQDDKSDEEKKNLGEVNINFGNNFSGTMSGFQIGNHNTMSNTPAPSSPSASPQTASSPAPAPQVSARKLFISYSRRDWDEFVAPMAQMLSEQKFPYWLDKVEIRGGENWRDRINDALVSCKIVVLFVSKDALESEYVRYEYRYAAQNPEKVLLPIMCRPVSLPPELSGVQYLNYYDTEIILTRLKELLA